MSEVVTMDEIRIHELYEQYVSDNPVWSRDFAETRLGELLRAVVGIWYMYYSDGKMISSEDPDQDLNSLARYIHYEYEDYSIDEVVSAMWDLGDEKLYRSALETLLSKTLKFIDRNPWLAGEKNHYDCLDFYEIEDIPVEEDDYSDCKSMAWQEKEDLKMYPPRSC